MGAPFFEEKRWYHMNSEVYAKFPLLSKTESEKLLHTTQVYASFCNGTAGDMTSNVILRIVKDEIIFPLQISNS